MGHRECHEQPTEQRTSWMSHWNREEPDEESVGSDVQLALQSFRNTVREGYSASPAQLLFSRKCRKSFPMQRTMLKPQLVVDAPRERKAMKDAQRLQYNKSSHQLAPIVPGSSIRMQLPNQDTWTQGTPHPTLDCIKSDDISVATVL